MEYYILNYLENEGFKQYSLILNQYKDFDEVPIFFKNLILCLIAIKQNEIPGLINFPNYSELIFPTNPSINLNVRNFISQTICEIDEDEVMDHSELGYNFLKYIKMILNDTFVK